MRKKAKAMVLASFVADSLALGAHWIYDTERIRKEFGRVDKLLKPAPNSYHAGKGQGEWTHYGDQAFVLLESVAAQKGFDLKDFASRWQRFFQNYHGYYDEATKGTLRNLSLGKGPESSDQGSKDAAEKADQDGFQEKEGKDSGIGIAQGFHDPDFPRAFGDGYKHDVHDPDGAHNKGDKCHCKQERAQGVPYLAGLLQNFGLVNNPIRLCILIFKIPLGDPSAILRLLRDESRRHGVPVFS